MSRSFSANRNTHDQFIHHKNSELTEDADSIINDNIKDTFNATAEQTVKQIL